MHDPIVEEIRKIRDQHAARFNYDVEAIYNDIKKSEKESGRQFVNLSAKRPLRSPAALKPGKRPGGRAA